MDHFRIADDWGAIRRLVTKSAKRKPADLFLLIRLAGYGSRRRVLRAPKSAGLEGKFASGFEDFVPNVLGAIGSNVDFEAFLASGPFARDPGRAAPAIRASAK